MKDKHENDLVSEKTKPPFQGWYLFFGVNKTCMQLLERIPACVLDTLTLWSKGNNASCARKGDYVYFKKN